MTANPKTLKEYREFYIQLAERARRLANTIAALAESCDHLRAQTELATKSLKRTRLLTNPYWLILAALLGGLVGGSLAALIALLAGL